MTSFRDAIVATFVPTHTELGLAVLRVSTGATLFLRHGLEKQPAHWAQFLAHFPDPIGIGSHPSFFVAFISDFICSVLIILGFGARWAALWSLGNIFVAWAFVHHFAFFGKGPASDHGELMILYVGALLSIVIAGPGAFSLDRILSKHKPWTYRH
jgi:putative oxidoreductase